MVVYRHPPDEEDLVNLVEWRAALIRDPVRRLRYLRRRSGLGPAPVRRPRRWRNVSKASGLALLFLVPHSPHSDANAPMRRPPRAPQVSPDRGPDAWLVEKTKDVETYSNGLRIENLYAVSHRPRAYKALPARGGEPVPRFRPAGIVFHTTESHLPPFDPERTPELKRAGRDLLRYVRENRSYHYLIDRFGRVWRVVRESDAASHAGWSVWADEEWTYINLNDSFLAVAFEASSGAPTVANPAQIHSGRVLTEMLRARYGISAANCVTHAQVSVNPRNHHIGYHTDWTSGFPFAALGLPDNYALPAPSLILFGFTTGSAPPVSGSQGIWSGVRAAERQIQSEAALRELSPARYRAMLRQRYRQTLAALERREAVQEGLP
jgi:hypothetical protein